MISCSEYDHIEIACLYSFKVELHFSGFSAIGIAKDTQYNEHKNHGILLSVDDKTVFYPFDTLTAITAHTPNTYFQHLEFSH